MLRPRVHPLSHPGIAAALKLTARGRGPNASAPRLRTQRGHAAVPPPGGNPALLLVHTEVPTGVPGGRGLGLLTRGRGRSGSPPRGDVRPVSRHVALETAFPSLWVSGGRLLPFSFFLFGGGRFLRSLQPVLSGPQFTFQCLRFPCGLDCFPSSCCILSQPFTPTLTPSRCVRCGQQPPTQVCPPHIYPGRAVTLVILGCTPGSTLRSGFRAAGQVPPALQCADTAL